MKPMEILPPVFTASFQYFTVPLPFLQTPAGMGPESGGIHRNGIRIELDSEIRLENHVYMQIYVYEYLYTNRSVVSIICTSAHYDFKDINTCL